MANINDIREYMSTWKKTTYAKGLDYCYSIKKDSAVYDLCIEVENKQRLFDKKMDGHSIERLPIINEGKTDIIFSNIFWKLSENYITPAYYIASIVNECVNCGISSVDEVAGIVGRGFRAFPSFLREMDLAYKISNLIPEAEIVNNPEQDVIEHTDILIRMQGMDYRLWSYQNYDKGLYNTARRFAEKRGVIPQGIHVLCPINISNPKETETVDGWCFYSDKYVRYIVNMIEIETPDSYAEVKRLGEAALKLYLKKANLVMR